VRTRCDHPRCVERWPLQHSLGCQGGWRRPGRVFGQLTKERADSRLFWRLLIIEIGHCCCRWLDRLVKMDVSDTCDILTKRIQACSLM
jgi:hypothetical protein